MIEAAVLSDESSDKEVGAPGLVIITAPEPCCDSSELPYEFMATTLAMMLSPHSKLKGAARRIVAGIVHVRSVDKVMSQFVSSGKNVTSSLVLIDTVYPVRADPPSFGAVQVMTTLSASKAVTGVLGYEGACAARILMI